VGDRHNDGQQEAPGARVCAAARGWRGRCKGLGVVRIEPKISLVPVVARQGHQAIGCEWVHSVPKGAHLAVRAWPSIGCTLMCVSCVHAWVWCWPRRVHNHRSCVRQFGRAQQYNHHPACVHTHTQLHKYEAGLTRCFTVAPLALCGDVHLENAAARWPTPRRNDCERVQGAVSRVCARAMACVRTQGGSS
jgi:hypothetical protein